jgi:hypothetical protein
MVPRKILIEDDLVMDSGCLMKESPIVPVASRSLPKPRAKND